MSLISNALRVAHSVILKMGSDETRRGIDVEDHCVLRAFHAFAFTNVQSVLRECFEVIASRNGKPFSALAFLMPLHSEIETARIVL